MDTKNTYARLSSTTRQRNVLIAVNLVLVIGITLQSGALLNRDTHVILTPTLSSETEIKYRTPSSHYLEQVTRDVATLFLNRHPQNLDYFRKNILRMTHPSAHGDIEVALLDTQRQYIATKTSTVFYPSEIYVDPYKLYSEIQGELHTFLGSDLISNEKATYGADWHYNAMRLQLMSFYQIEEEEAQSKDFHETPVNTGAE